MTCCSHCGAREASASQLKTSWHGWLHRTVDVPPSSEAYTPREWQKPHQPNLTGTPAAYRPHSPRASVRPLPVITWRGRRRVTSSAFSTQKFLGSNRAILSNGELIRAGRRAKKSSAGEVERAKALIKRVAERAMAMDGTCTGEHGIGEGKKQLLVIEHGPGTVEAMRLLKRAFDPEGVMNPGKIV